MQSDVCICAEDTMATLVLLPFHKAVVFISGADDREALTLPSLMSRHPAVWLTQLRMVQNATAQAHAKAWTSMFETKRNGIVPVPASSALGQPGRKRRRSRADPGCQEQDRRFSLT